jgi:peptide chain release factor subunit 1
MVLYEDIRRLQRYSPGTDSLILSLYVNVDQSVAANLNRGFETAAEDQLRKLAEQESRSENGMLPRFEKERERALQFLREYTPKGKGVVIFSDSRAGFWWQREIQVGLPTSARWSPQPWVRPLLELLESNDRLGVVLMDKQRARIITLDADGIEQRADIASDVRGRHHTTGTDHIWSQAQMDRDHVKHIKWHARRVADELAVIVDRLKLTRLMIGGPVEATSLFIAELPKRLQHMIVGTISVAIDISLEKLSGELRHVRDKVEQKDELAIVESLITAARKHERAVLGITETLEAVLEGRVYCMVVDKSYRTEGRQCSSCNGLLVDAPEKCPFCGGTLLEAADLINRTSHRVLEQAGRVQVVSGVAADRLADVARIGAFLRF